MNVSQMLLVIFHHVPVGSISITHNVLRICEVRIAETLKLNINLNNVFHIYAVSKS
jgi:hypothetical protein